MTRRRFDDFVDGFGAGAVAGRSRQSALRCPASVAVHDDCYVHYVLCITKLWSDKKSCAAGCLDHRLDMVEVSIQGVLAERCQPIDRLRAALFERFGTSQVLGLFQLA